MDLGRPGFLSRVSSVGSGSSGFGKGNPPSDPPKSIFKGKDPPPTVTSVGSVGFRVGSGGLGGWVSFQFPVDSPTNNTCSPPQLSTSLIWFCCPKVFSLSYFLGCIWSPAAPFSSFSIPLSFFLFPSSPLLTRQPSPSHQNKISLSKEEIKGLRLKFQLQIVGGKKSKLYLFISTSLTSILIL